MKMKKMNLWMLTAILTCGLGMLLTSCSKSDNDAGAQQKMTPLSNADMESLRQAVIGIWVDTENIQLLGYSKAYAFDEYGNVECKYNIPNNNDDSETIDDDDLVMVSYEGKWKVVDDIKDRWTDSGENCIGLALELKALGSEDLGVVNDTLLVSVEKDGKCTFLTTDEVDQIAYQGSLGMTKEDIEEAKAMGRAALRRASLWDKLKGPSVFIAEVAKQTWDKVLVPVGKFVGDVVVGLGRNALAFTQTVLNAAFKGLSFDTATKTVSPSLADWMGAAYPTTGAIDPLLSDISMPGTHDTFSFTLSLQMGGLEGKTQMYNIETQWAMGVRCFDVRLNTLEVVDKITSAAGYGFSQKLGIYHGPIYLQKTLRSGLEDIVAMVKKHPTETAIVIMKFENHENAENIAEINKTLENFKDNILFNPSPGLRLSQCRGKIVILQRYNEQKSTFAHLHATDWPQDGQAKIEFSNNATEDLFVQDMYEVPKEDSRQTFWDKKEATFEKVVKLAVDESRKNTWFVNHESAYVGVINYAANANEMIPRIQNILDKKEYENKRIGIVVTDFVGFKGLYDARFSYVDCTMLPGKIISHNSTAK